MAVYTTTFYSNVGIGGLKAVLLATPTYVFGSNGTRMSLDPGNVTENSQKYHNEVVRQLIFGKKLQASNLYDMAVRYNWTSGTIYDMYDHRTVDLASKSFFVIASNRAVYKCLYNDGATASTIEPSSLTATPVKLADGYVWKYLFRLTVNQLNNLTTSTLIPIVADANTTAAAVNGSIDVVVAEIGGTGYTATHSGTITQVVSTTVLKLPTDVLPYDGMLNKSAFYVSNGPGAGQISVIDNYFSNGSGRYVTLATPLTSVDITSEYQITPYVAITGDGAGAIGRTLISNTAVVGVEMIATGNGYTWADAVVQANSAYGAGANLVPIIAPQGGHGSDVTSELFTRHLQINVDVAGTEGATLANNFTYGVYGLLTGVKQASNTAVDYTANTFNNAAYIETVQVGGVLQKGDWLKSDDTNQAKATIITTFGANLFAIYDTRTRAEQFDTFTSSVGVTGAITAITQPNVYCHDSKLLCFEDINTITHTTSTDTINIILRY